MFRIPSLFDGISQTLATMTASIQQPFISRFKNFISSNQLVRPSSHIVLAVSGGMDSLTMLHLFAQLQNEWQLTLGIAHVNHQLRGAEANEDEEFVRSAADRYRLSFSSARVDTLGHAHHAGMGKQEAARELRYEFLEQTRLTSGAHTVATAHTADDNAETVLMNALRGSGIHGLAGIPLRREPGNIVRPMLFAFRQEIEQYVKECGIAFRHDSSNDSLAYQRNRIRRIVLPALQSNVDANILQSLNRVSAAMREAEQAVAADLASVLPAIVSHDESSRTVLNIALLSHQSPLTQDELILTVFRALDIEPSAEKISAVLDLCSSQTGRSLRLSKSVAVYRDRERLVFGRPLETPVFEFPVVIGTSYVHPEFEFSSTVEQRAPKEFSTSPAFEFVDGGQLGNRLLLRNWREGDWFVPLGLHAKKKLSDFFTDAKVPLFRKHHVPVLESDGSIVWVCGYRLDERFRVTKKTATVVKLQYVEGQERISAGVSTEHP